MSKKDTEKLVSRAKELSSDGDYIRLFDKEENYKELIRNTELAAAREETKIEMAKKCLEKNMDNDLIAELTGLSIKEIESLKKEV